VTERLPTDVCHLYRITDPNTGKFYIGKHRGARRAQYWGGGKRIKAYVKKHGYSHLKYEVLVIASEDYIYDLEQRYVTEDFIRSNSNCLNLCKGGIGGNLGQTPWNKGKPWSDEVKEKMRQAKVGKIGNRLGKTNSPEHRAAISAGKKGKVFFTPEHRAKISAKNLGRSFGKVECPYCNKVVAAHTKNRYHFDNCKDKE
jgi:hypothetical protein